MKTKVIHILSHSPSPNAHRDINKARLPDEEHYIRISKPPYWVGFFDVDWHVQVAQETLKRTKKYELECWRPYDVADRIYSKRINGITHKIFPHRKIRIGKYSFRERYPQLIQTLKKEAKKGNIIVHMHTVNSKFAIRTFKKIDFSYIPLVGQHHGGIASWVFLYNSPPLKYFFSKDDILNQYDHIFVLSESVKREFEQYVGKGKVSIQTMGIDFEFFKLLNKEKCRYELGLSLDRKIVLFIGRFTNVKGFFDLLKAIPYITYKHDDILFLFVGGDSNQFKNKIIDIPKNCCFIERVAKEILLKYYNAADIFILPSHMEGCPVSLLEALACNLPIITTSVGGIPLIKTNIPEVKLIQPANFKSIVDPLNSYLTSIPVMDVREKVKKYYSWDVIIDNTLKIYENFEEKYGL